jgi:hypothetical protein
MPRTCRYAVHVSWTPRDGGKHIYERGTLVKGNN